MSDPTSSRLAEIQGRLDAATAGPWEAVGTSIEQVDGDCKVVVGLEERGAAYLRYEVLVCEKADSEFIAHAREDIPFLLTEHSRLLSVIEGQREVIERVRHLADEAERIHVTPDQWWNLDEIASEIRAALTAPTTEKEN